MRRSLAGPAFALPALFGLTLFVAIPFLLAFAFSFTNLRPGSPLSTEWVGIQQYARIFADESFLRGLANNTVFTLVVVPVQTGLALGLALLLHRKMRARALFRTR